MKNTRFISITLLLLIQMTAITSNARFTYKKLSPHYIKSMPGKYVKELNQARKSAVDLTRYLPKGYVKTGTVDYTAYIQKGINENPVVLMPDFPLLVRGIYTNSNTVLIFRVHSKLIMQPNNASRYQIIAIHGVQNVTIYNAVLEGDRNRHLGTEGEWGFGIDIRGSKNITIVNSTIKNCWGDGLMIADTKLNMVPAATTFYAVNNIDLINLWVDNNRRNGISITGGQDILLQDVVMSNTNGTNPACGIDIEPDNSRGILNNITLNNPFTFNNVHAGININLMSYVGVMPKQGSININNHTDSLSQIGMYHAGFKKPSSTVSVKAKMKGKVIVKNSKWIGNTSNASPSANASANYQDIDIQNLQVYDVINGKNIRSTKEEARLKKLMSKEKGFIIH